MGEWLAGLPKKLWEGGKPSTPVGCFVVLFTVMLGALVAVVMILIVVRALSGSDRQAGPSDTERSADIEQTVNPPAPGAALYVDASNPNHIFPAAGTYSMVNGRFVPNCGPDEEDRQLAIGSGSIEVWDSGAFIELSDGSQPIGFRRTSHSQDEAVYEGAVGFVGFELVFDSPTTFDATISYTGDQTCVRRSAEGTLEEADSDLQHGDEAAPGDGETTDLGGGLQEAGEDTLAVVTIDDVEYEFRSVGGPSTCDPDFFGGFQVVLYTEGFVDSLNMALFADLERSTVTMKLQEEDLDLVADARGEWAAVEPGTSAVLDVQIDGTTATGSLSFINEDRAFNSANLPLDPIQATFTVTCAP